MKEKLLSYFRVQRRIAIAYLLAGMLTVAVGVTLLFFPEGGFWRGLSSSVIGLSIIQLWTGGRLWKQTADLHERLPAQLRLQPGLFRREELERCEQEEARYNKQRTIVIWLVVLGIVLALAGGVLSVLPFTAGMGFGLCIQGALMLVLNLMGQWHQSLYHHAVERFNGKAD